jgi:hypothetical protein
MQKKMLVAAQPEWNPYRWSLLLGRFGGSTFTTTFTMSSDKGMSVG